MAGIRLHIHQYSTINLALLSTFLTVNSRSPPVMQNVLITRIPGVQFFSRKLHSKKYSGGRK